MRRSAALLCFAAALLWTAPPARAADVLRIGLHEQAGCEGTAILASRKMYDVGLTSAAHLAGHSFGITQ